MLGAMPSASVPSADRSCEACGRAFDPAEHAATYDSPFLMLRVCPTCIEAYVRRHGTRCANCGGPIPPHSQVAVYHSDEGGSDGAALVGHTTVACNPAGNSFYGYWGKGRLASTFRNIEMC
jgi:hypothetical protein